MNAEMLRYFQRLFEKHARKLRNIVARGVVNMVDDGKKMQTNQITLLNGEIIEGAERAQQYGFSSHPQKDAECFVVFAGADRAHPIIFSVDDRRYRIKGLKQGEVAIYTDEGDQICLKRNNTIEVTTKHFIVNAEDDAQIITKKMHLYGSESINIETPNLNASGAGGKTSTTATFTGDIQQKGTHTSSGDQIAGGVSQISHLHRDSGGHGNSGTPITS